MVYMYFYQKQKLGLVRIIKWTLSSAWDRKDSITCWHVLQQVCHYAGQQTKTNRGGWFQNAVRQCGESGNNQRAFPPLSLRSLPRLQTSTGEGLVICCEPSAWFGFLIRESGRGRRQRRRGGETVSGETVFRHMSSNVTDNHTSPQKKRREKKSFEKWQKCRGRGRWRQKMVWF